MGLETVFKMKQDMMVVALDAVEDEIMKIELVPLVFTEKKMNLVKIQEELLTGKDMVSVIKKAVEQKQQRTIIYKPRKWCSDNKIMLFNYMVLDLDIVKEVNKK